MYLIDRSMMLIKMALTLSVLYSNNPNIFALVQETESDEFQSDITDLDIGYSTVINYLEKDFPDVDYDDEFLSKSDQPSSNEEEKYRHAGTQKEFERDLRTYKLEEEVAVKRSDSNSLNPGIQNGTQKHNIQSTANIKNQNNGSRLATHNGMHEDNLTSNENKKHQSNGSSFAIPFSTQDGNTTSTENMKKQTNGSSFAIQSKTQDGNVTSFGNRQKQSNSSSSTIPNKTKEVIVTSTEVSKNKVDSSSLVFQKGVHESTTATSTENSKNQVSVSSLAIQNEEGNVPLTEEEKKCRHDNITCIQCSSLSPNCHYHHKEKKCFYSKVVHGNDIYECGARYFAQDGWMPLIAAVGVVGVATVGVVAFVGWEVYRRCIKKHAIPREETQEMRNQIAGIRARRCNTPELMMKLGKILAETDPETQK